MHPLLKQVCVARHQIVSTAPRAVNYSILLPLLLSIDYEHLGIWGSQYNVLAPEEKLLAPREDEEAVGIPR